MTDEQLATDYETPSALTNNQIAAALTDNDIEKYIKFSYINGATIWRGLLAEAAMRLYDDQGSCKHWHEFSKADDCLRLAMERRIWAHYEHAREKHPYFCDHISWFDNRRGDAQGRLNGMRKLLEGKASISDIQAEDLLLCEVFEMVEAVARKDYAAAVEECYDAIAVLLRIIDVLEGRQKLGKPEKGAAK